MSDDIKKYRAIVEQSHANVSGKKRLTENTQSTAQMILESLQGQKVSKDQLFGALINNPRIRSREAAVRVLHEMKAGLKKSV